MREDFPEDFDDEPVTVEYLRGRLEERDRTIADLTRQIQMQPRRPADLAQAPAPVRVTDDVDGWVRRLRKTEEAGQARHMSKADRLAIADFLAALEAPDAGVVAELVEALRKFEAHYPRGINPFLDDAHSKARAILAKLETRP